MVILLHDLQVLEAYACQLVRVAAKDRLSRTDVERRRVGDRGIALVVIFQQFMTRQNLQVLGRNPGLLLRLAQRGLL
jgi:hypothetical protein